MPDFKELDSVTIIIQDHERRITTLENTMNMIVPKMESVENTVKAGNDEQKAMLQTINNRMMDEFFRKKSTNHTNTWNLLFKILGGGSFLYLVFDTITSNIRG